MNILNNLILATGGFNQQILSTIMIVGLIAFFYFFMIRPQSKKKKEMQNMMNALKKGDKILSIGGIHGKISAIKDNNVVIKIDANAEITLEKSAISKVITDVPETKNK